jgi:uncharacterized delta-60 repeat protein
MMNLTLFTRWNSLSNPLKHVFILNTHPLLFLLCFIIAFDSMGQTGVIDMSFTFQNKGATASWDISTAAIQSDGCIILAGRFKKFENQKKRKLIRILPDGSFDKLFEVGYDINRSIFDIAIQADGKIWVAGSFTRFKGQKTNQLVRLHSDGSIDESFSSNKGFGFESEVKLIRIQQDGKILLQGNFSRYNDYQTCGLVRLHADGSVDTSFKGRTLCRVESTGINDVLLLPDGKIMIVGRFPSYDDNMGKGIARLHSDGSLDTSFFKVNKAIIGTSLGAGNGSIHNINLLNDSSMIISGSFTRYGGRKVRYLAKIDHNNQLDTTFNTERGPSFFVETILKLPDNHLIIGHINRYNKVKTNAIAKIRDDGSLDPTFTLHHVLVGYPIEQFLLQSDGKIIIVAKFTLPGQKHTKVLRVE